MSYKIHLGDNVATLKNITDNSIDSIITDPPYGIEFLGKDWDKNTGALETWRECLRVLKPGGYILAFSSARTYHQLATNIESVGFEIRDQLMWLYASGFPKAQDIGKAIDRKAGKKDKNYGSSKGKGGEVFEQFNHPLCNKCGKGISYEAKCKDTDCGMRYKYQTAEAQQWSGWKTALKPAHEPIVMARKPFKGSAIDNVLKHGVGALNIDESRVAYDSEADFKEYVNNIKGPLERSTAKAGDNIGMHEGKTGFKAQKGKVVLPSGGANGLSRLTFGEGETTNADSFKQYTPNQQGRYPANVIGEVEGYQKYFYCPKVTRKERMPFNNHPTVKPVALMRYLIKLVTPDNSTVLDPFCGSGSTGIAAVELGHSFIGCELDANYVDICIRRIQSWTNNS